METKKEILTTKALDDFKNILERQKQLKEKLILNFKEFFEKKYKGFWSTRARFSKKFMGGIDEINKNNSRILDEKNPKGDRVVDALKCAAIAISISNSLASAFDIITVSEKDIKGSIDLTDTANELETIQRLVSKSRNKLVPSFDNVTKTITSSIDPGPELLNLKVIQEKLSNINISKIKNECETMLQQFPK